MLSVLQMPDERTSQENQWRQLSMAGCGIPLQSNMPEIIGLKIISLTTKKRDAKI